MSDHFALVPRAFADRFFGAVSTFYKCDGASWPPPVSWWQPAYKSLGFEESVLFRHLHVAEVPYRFYSMFEFVLARGSWGAQCDLGSSTYTTACNLLGMSDILRPPFSK